jgi:type IV pilus assembly protein PilA
MEVANMKMSNDGGRTMKTYLKRIHRESKGFTLVELLIVIAILGVLAAVVLPNVTGLVGEGETEAAKAELVTVQTAMDTMMAKARISSVTATSATNDMSGFPTGNALYPSYLRTKTTQGTYSCSTSGNVTQVTTGY